MNGRHPIDDLFARTLRDAEATPPPAVWEGIVRERGKGRRVAAKRRSRWGLAALLLLLLGSAGYWTLTDEGGKEHAALSPSQGGQARADGNPSVEAAGTEEPEAPGASEEQVGQTDASSGSEEQNEAQKTAISTRSGSAENGANTEQVTGSTTEQRIQHAPRTPATAHAAVRATSSKTKQTNESKQELKSSDPDAAGSRSDAEPAINASGTASEGVEKSGSAEANAAAAKEGADASRHAWREQRARLSPDVHVALLNGLVTPFLNNAVTAPGPILQGDSTPAYVLKKGNWWVAVQGEWAMLNGEWKGTGSEVCELNKSETWRSGQGLGLVFGRQWLSGWSLGLGIGANKQRSRFLRREVEPGHSELVVDTTWTGTPMGQVTNYTWDIVETTVVEPGVERDYSATNSYTRLRIAPEVGYQLLQKKRFSLGARLAPVMMIDIDRKGNTLVQTSSMDTLETAAATGALALTDASLDNRFPMTFPLDWSCVIACANAGPWARYRHSRIGCRAPKGVGHPFP
jgi:hypothetical protein